MSQLLRHPNRLRPLVSRARATNLGPFVLATPDNLFVPPIGPPPEVSANLSPAPDRVHLPKRAPVPSSSQVGPVPKRLVKDRWYYEPVLPIPDAPLVFSVPSLIVTLADPSPQPTLVPRAAWMCDADDHTDA